MPPLAQPFTRSPSPHPLSHHSPLHRRWTSCTYYDTSCSTRHTVLLAIIVAVCALTALALLLLIIRHSKRRAVVRRARLEHRVLPARQGPTAYTHGAGEGVGTASASAPFGRGNVDGLVHGGGQGTVGGGEGPVDLDVPPPAYSRVDKEMGR